MQTNRQELFRELVVGGVDIHMDVHVAAILSRTGALLGGTAEFPTTLGSHMELLR